ncbi:MAG: RT0821/Lpp0805 family surface protein [Woeseiaceae bacterium]
MTGKPYRTGRYRILSVALMSAVLLGAGCASQEDPFDESDAGQIIGGVAGAAAGSQIGEGSGQTVATIAGALIGAVVGERIGARMEDDDVEYTAHALEENETGETSAWENPDTGNEFWVTPTETFEDSGRPCREFDFRVETEEGEDEQERTACRDSDGTWEIVGS